MELVVGKITYKLWNETEAEKFTKIAMSKGVPREDIYLEKESTNLNYANLAMASIENVLFENTII